MRRVPAWRRYMRFWGPDVASDIDDELECHIDLRTEELVRGGMERRRARARAVAEFGDLAGAKAECVAIGEELMRRRSRAELWDTMLQDVRYGARALARNRGFTVAAVIALAVGIGANAGVFALVDAAAFRPLPVRAPEQLVAVYGTQGDARLLNVPYRVHELLREQRTAFTDVASFTERPVSLLAGGEPREVWSHLVSDNYFSLLGVRAARGRTLSPGELREPVVVLSDALWRGHFAADPDVVGRTIELNGYAYTVIGVAPREFQGTRLLAWAPELWLPAGMYGQVVPGSDDALASYAGNGFTAIARLREGMSREALPAALERVAEQVRAAGPPWLREFGFTAVENRTPVNPWLAPPAQLRAIGRIFVAGVALVLLIACADVANLLLARMTARRHEIGVRLSLGAGRLRLVRQLLTENLLLAVVAGIAAIPLAYAARHIATLLQPPTDYATAFRPVLDTRVLVFTAVTTLLAGVAAGILPAVRGSRGDLAGTLRAHAAGVVAGRSRLRQTLVVLQLAISVVVLSAAGLFARNLHQAQAVHPGFDVENGVVFTLRPHLLRGYDEARIADLYRELVERLSALPGVRGVTRASSLPLDGTSNMTIVYADGRATTPRDGVWTDYVAVDPGYYAVIGTPVEEGREFASSDRNGPPGVVINSALADRLWPGEAAVGKRLRNADPNGDAYEVIGVAQTGRYNRLSETAAPSVSFDLQRNPQASTTILVRTAAGPASLFPQIRRIVRELDARLPLVGLKTLREHIASSYAPAQSGAFASAVFGALALLLAAAGVYGVISYAVAQQRREIGIRMALGATRHNVVRLVLRGSALLAVLGIALGSVLTIPLGFGLRGMMYSGSGHDPLALAAVCLLITGVALLAAWLPARRAARVDPALAMRS